MRSIVKGLALGLIVFTMSQLAHATCNDTCAWSKVWDAANGSFVFVCGGECSGIAGEFQCYRCMHPHGGEGTPCYCAIV